MSLSATAEAFERTCRDRRAETALIWLPDRRAISFSDLDEQYRTIRKALQRHGVGAGCCVVSILGNQPAFVPLLVACMDAGAALLPLGEATDAEALTIIDRSGAIGVVTARSLRLEAADASPIDARISLIRRSDRQSARAYERSIVIKLTSGSTDLPKATLTGEHALINDGRSITSGMGIGPHDVNLALIPLSHSYAIGNIVMPLVLQGPVAALRSSFNPAHFLQDLHLSQATVFPGVPFMFDRLRASLDQHELPQSLRLMITAGARIDPQTLRWFHARGSKIHSFYGTSETGGITFDDSDEFCVPVHVGRPLPGVAVEIHPDADNAGGRVFVRSGGMASGYLSSGTPDADTAFQHGGFRTSDLGYLDSAGRLVLTGRVTPLVNIAGRKVDPAEVERVLVAVPGVSDARVVGVDCQTRGEELVAFVVRAGSPLTSITLRQSCAAVLSPYKIPRRFIFLDCWPVDERGKVDKRALEALAARP